jgi:predicted glycosyltransferase involved in capsule biosynthesis
MILTTKEAFFEIKGYDEFFHFYGSEDVDLYARLENAGYKSNLVTDIYFYHN